MRNSWSIVREMNFSLSGGVTSASLDRALGVARHDLDFAVRGARHAGQRGHRLALRAGGKDDDAVGRQLVDVVDIDHRSFLYVQVAEFNRNGDVVHHRAADDSHLASEAFSRFEHLLNPVQVGSERRQDDAALRRAECLVNRLTDHAL